MSFSFTVAGFPINFVGIILAVLYLFVTFLVKRIPKFGLKRGSIIGGWVTSIAGFGMLVISGIIPSSVLVFAIVLIFSVIAIVVILSLVLAVGNPLSINKSKLKSVAEALWNLGILLGILFAILNLVIVP